MGVHGSLSSELATIHCPIDGDPFRPADLVARTCLRNASYSPRLVSVLLMTILSVIIISLLRRTPSLSALGSEFRSLRHGPSIRVTCVHVFIRIPQNKGQLIPLLRVLSHLTVKSVLFVLPCSLQSLSVGATVGLDSVHASPSSVPFSSCSTGTKRPVDDCLSMTAPTNKLEIDMLWRCRKNFAPHGVIQPP